MNRVVSFISGNEYSLSDLFGGDTKVIIPDLQRDYCWGIRPSLTLRRRKQENWLRISLRILSTSLRTNRIPS